MERSRPSRTTSSWAPSNCTRRRSSISTSTTVREYAQRTTYLSTVGADAGKLVGYAPISSSNAGCGIETLPTTPTSGLGSIGVAGNPPYSPGTPANCLGATRAVSELTGEFVYRFYNNPKYGRLQYAMQYSYLQRVGWAGVTSGTFGSATATYGAPKANNNMVFTSLRYYLPYCFAPHKRHPSGCLFFALKTQLEKHFAGTRTPSEWVIAYYRDGRRRS